MPKPSLQIQVCQRAMQEVCGKLGLNAPEEWYEEVIGPVRDGVLFSVDEALLRWFRNHLARYLKSQGRGSEGLGKRVRGSREEGQRV